MLQVSALSFQRVTRYACGQTDRMTDSTTTVCRGSAPRHKYYGICMHNEICEVKTVFCEFQNFRFHHNTSVFPFYRGVLQTGSYTMTLWKGPSQTSKLVLPDGPVYPPNPCCPGNSNPDDRAIKVTVLFPRHSYPVFFPSSGAATHAFLLRSVSLSTCVCAPVSRDLSCDFLVIPARRLTARW